MKIKHWNYNYLKSKLKYALKKSNYKSAPWIAFDAVDYLQQRLDKSQIVFEWGSGRSTLWFASRVKSITSIEDNEHWFNDLNNKIKNSSIDNITLLLKTMDIEYENSIEHFENNTFDLIIIDGNRRDLCAEKAFDKLKVGGSIILDDAQRYLPSKSKSPNSFKTWEENPNKNWIKLKKMINNCELIFFEDGISDTAILTKKA